MTEGESLTEYVEVEGIKETFHNPLVRELFWQLKTIHHCEDSNLDLSRLDQFSCLGDPSQSIANAWDSSTEQFSTKNKDILLLPWRWFSNVFGIRVSVTKKSSSIHKNHWNSIPGNKGCRAINVALLLGWGQNINHQNEQQLADYFRASVYKNASHTM